MVTGNLARVYSGTVNTVLGSRSSRPVRLQGGLKMGQQENEQQCEPVREILFERHVRGGATWPPITLDRPDKGNALTLPMLVRLGEIADELRGDRRTRAVVLRTGSRFFCTDGDIEAWSSHSAHEWSVIGFCAGSTFSCRSPACRNRSSPRSLDGNVNLSIRKSGCVQSI